MTNKVVLHHAAPGLASKNAMTIIRAVQVLQLRSHFKIDCQSKLLRLDIQKQYWSRAGRYSSFRFAPLRTTVATRPNDWHCRGTRLLGKCGRLHELWACDVRSFNVVSEVRHFESGVRPDYLRISVPRWSRRWLRRGLGSRVSASCVVGAVYSAGVAGWHGGSNCLRRR